MSGNAGDEGWRKGAYDLAQKAVHGSTRMLVFIAIPSHTHEHTSSAQRVRHKQEQSEEEIDCHHQDSNQGPSLVASDAVTTELWCRHHPSRDRLKFSSDIVSHTLCESTLVGVAQTSL